MSPAQEQEERDLNIPLTDTQQRFVESEAPIVFLIGPEGEGKTYAGLAGLIAHAQARRHDPEPVRACLIRDTFENILTKTVPSIQKAIVSIARKNDAPELITQFEWHRGYKVLECKALGLIVDLFGADSQQDVAKLQGGEWSFIWLEEPAPMYSGNNAGLPKAVFSASLSRAARGGGSMRLQITMNPADEDHWTFDMAVRRPIMRPSDMPDIWTETFFIAYGENPTRTERQRQATKAAYKDDPALYARLVKGQFAYVQVGEAVTPEYQAIHHFRAPNQPYDLKVIPGATGFRSWDGGHNPTCLIGQITPSGHLHFIHGLILPKAGMKQLIVSRVLPIVNRYYQGVVDWIDTGDPSLTATDDSDTDQSPATRIESLLDTRFDPSVHWPHVKEPMKEALSMMIDGKPYVRVGKDCDILHKALRGGWHFDKLKSGQILGEKPVKDIHSHPGDCFGALCHKLLGKQDRKDRRTVKQASTRSYG